MSGGHSGEEIPVPIPNTEVKLSNADDTAPRGGKVGSRRAFFLSFYFFILMGNAFLWVFPCFFLRRVPGKRPALRGKGFRQGRKGPRGGAAPSVSGPWKRSFQMESGMRLLRAAWWNLSARKRNQKKKCFLFDINAD